MPNKAQKDLIDSFFSENGFYIEVIHDNTSFSCGTKLLYLERAISQECQVFLLSLDKLYHPDVGDAETQNIEFIRAFKLINDLCFNNEVKFDDHGLRKALTHYFRGISNPNVEEAEDAQAIKTYIQQMIGARISELQEKNTNTAAEKITREQAESGIIRHTEWRVTLDLPLDQQAEASPEVVAAIISDLNGALSLEQYQSLPREVRNIIAQHTDNTRKLIQGLGATFPDIQSLTVQELEELISNIDDVSLLVTEAITITELFAPAPEIRAELFTNAYSVNELISEVDITFPELLALAPEVRAQLLTYSDTVVELVNEAFVLSDFLALNQEVRAKVCTNADAVITLVTEHNLTSIQLSSLSASQLQLLIDDRHSELAQEILNPVSEQNAVSILKCNKGCRGKH